MTTFSRPVRSTIVNIGATPKLVWGCPAFCPTPPNGVRGWHRTGTTPAPHSGRLHGGAERGTIVIIALILIAALVVMTAAFMVHFSSVRRSMMFREGRERGLGIVEAGVEKAIWELSSADGGTARYAGEVETPFADGFFTTRVTRVEGGAEAWDIQATGFLRDEVDSPPRKFSVVPAVRARVAIERAADGRARRVRVTRWETVTPPARPVVPTQPAATRNAG